ncbi:unnamed protein product, partial [Durusdinium trenchii]
MISQLALICTTVVLCIDQGFAARQLGDIALHGNLQPSAEATAACEGQNKHDCKHFKAVPSGYKCDWMYECYKGVQKSNEAPKSHPSECGALKMYGVGACITVSLAPPTPPKPMTSDEEATDVPSDEGSEEIEEEDEEETDLPGTVEDEVAKMEK